MGNKNSSNHRLEITDPKAMADPEIRHYVKRISKTQKLLEERRNDDERRKLESSKKDQSINDLRQKMFGRLDELNRKLLGCRSNPRTVRKLYEKEILEIVHDGLTESMLSVFIASGGKTNAIIKHWQVIPLEVKLLCSQHNGDITDHQKDCLVKSQQRDVQILYALVTTEIQLAKEKLLKRKIRALRKVNKNLKKAYKNHVDVQERMIASYRDRVPEDDKYPPQSSSTTSSLAESIDCTDEKVEEGEEEVHIEEDQMDNNVKDEIDDLVIIDELPNLINESTTRTSSSSSVKKRKEPKKKKNNDVEMSIGSFSMRSFLNNSKKSDDFNSSHNTASTSASTATSNNEEGAMIPNSIDGSEDDSFDFNRSVIISPLTDSIHKPKLFGDSSLQRSAFLSSVADLAPPLTEEDESSTESLFYDDDDYDEKDASSERQRKIKPSDIDEPSMVESYEERVKRASIRRESIRRNLSSNASSSNNGTAQGSSRKDLLARARQTRQNSQRLLHVLGSDSSQNDYGSSERSLRLSGIIGSNSISGRMSFGSSNNRGSISSKRLSSSSERSSIGRLSSSSERSSIVRRQQIRSSFIKESLSSSGGSRRTSSITSIPETDIVNLSFMNDWT